MLAGWLMRMNEETREKKKRKEEKKEKEEAAEEAGAGLSLNNIIMLVIRMLLQVWFYRCYLFNSCFFVTADIISTIHVAATVNLHEMWREAKVFFFHSSSNTS